MGLAMTSPQWGLSEATGQNYVFEDDKNEQIDDRLGIERGAQVSDDCVHYLNCDGGFTGMDVLSRMELYT